MTKKLELTDDEYNLMLSLTQFGKDKAVTDREKIRISQLRKKLFTEVD